MSADPEGIVPRGCCRGITIMVSTSAGRVLERAGMAVVDNCRSPAMSCAPVTKPEPALTPPPVTALGGFPEGVSPPPGAAPSAAAASSGVAGHTVAPVYPAAPGSLVFVVGKRCDSPPTPATSGFPEGVRPPPAAAPRGVAESGVALPTAASSGVTGRTFAVFPAAATGSVVTGKRCGLPPTPATSGVGERTGLPPARTYPPSEGTRTAANAAINVARRPR